MWWDQQSLAYFTPGQRRFVVRAWWGDRVVVGLDRLQAVDRTELADELRQAESQIVMRGLQRLVVNVLHALEGSDRYPLAPLAKAVLTGQLDAIPPLIDALEEANDPLAARVWAWKK